MNHPKRHLLVRGKGRRTACGIQSPPRVTRDPSQVTCGGCQRTIQMADAEVRRTGPPSIEEESDTTQT